MTSWRCGRFELTLERPLIMGVINVTPDSFSDGGRFVGVDAAVRHAETLVAEGADILDVGGESTRPGAAIVSAAEELGRVLPLLRAATRLPVPVSIDTSQPDVMRAALDAGVAIVNDVRALRVPGAFDVVARDPSACGVVLMHMQGEPQTMQVDPSYVDVVREVREMLLTRAAELESAGVARSRIVVDPGFGFGKTKEHNIRLLARLRDLANAGYPLLAGLSRKSVLGRLTDRPPAERVAASVAAALVAVERGARIVRVHDVAATRDALRVWQAVAAADPAPGAEAR
ncbi:MAG TPA: dihydropteroate synthase [Burkholderiaceae bacterium]|nr:dihydropteroate synthase [Burkholderiaceae bacterium]